MRLQWRLNGWRLLEKIYRLLCRCLPGLLLLVEIERCCLKRISAILLHQRDLLWLRLSVCNRGVLVWNVLLFVLHILTRSVQTVRALCES